MTPGQNRKNGMKKNKKNVLPLLGGGLCLTLFLQSCDPNKTPLSGQRMPIASLSPEQKLNASHSKRLATPLPPPSPLKTWSQPDASSSHDKGHLSLNAGTGALKVLWSESVSSSSTDARILETPAAQTDALFLLDHRGRVLKVDGKNGKVVFSTSIAPEEKTGEPILGGGCTLGENRVFVASPYSELLALDATDGRIVWRKALRSPARSAPTLHEGQLYVSTLQNHVQAFNLEGELLWTHEGMPELLGILGLASPAASQDLVVVAYTSGEVVALRRQTGSVVWSDVIAGPRNAGEAQSLPHVRSNPVIHGDTVFIVSYAGQLTALNLHNGHRRWDVGLLSTICTPVLAGQTLFMVANNRELVALDAGTGQVIWVTPLSQLLPAAKAPESLPMWYGPLLVDGHILLLSSTGHLVAVDPLTGKHVPSSANLFLKDTFALPPIVVQGHLYTLAESGKLYGIGRG